MSTVKGTAFYRGTDPCRLDYGILFGVHGVTYLLHRAALYAHLCPEAFALVHTALYALRRTVVTGRNDALVAHDDRADVPVLLAAARPFADMFGEHHEPLIPFIHSFLRNIHMFHHNYVR